MKQCSFFSVLELKLQPLRLYKDTNIISIFALLHFGVESLALAKICQCTVDRFNVYALISRTYKVMILHICHKWLQHSYIIELSFSNGDKCAALCTLKMARYTTHAQWSKGKYIIPLPCCDMHIFHSSFMRVLNPERDQKKIQRQTSTAGFY